MSARRPDWMRHAVLLLPAGVLLILGAMVVPLPRMVLDLLLTTNIMASVVVLMVAMTLVRPVDFSAFPSLLLVLTLFRLCLNVAATRLILLAGERGEDVAGQVIRAFGHFVIGGEPIVGAAVFLALIVMQYVVITHGAVRVSEVIARFTLDALPGKQMAVDADLNSGAITEEQAQARRRAIGREAEFYGSMDGAVRFSQRDALAAIMLLCINVVAGLGLGVLKFGMPVGEALKLYTLLTIGDGIAAAVPALLVSVAGGIIATRAAAESQLGSEVAQQVLRVRQPLAVAAVLLGGLAIVPGMPKLPFVLLAATCGAVAWKMGKPAESTEVEEAPPAPPADPGFADLVRVDPISVELGMSLLSIADEAQGGDLLARIKTVRKQVAQELGLPVPAVRVRDRVDLPGQAYRIKMMDADVARGTLLPHSLLAILPGSEEGVPDGVPTRDPTFGLPARWIRASDREAALSSGCTVVEPSVAVATHLGHVLRREAWRLLGRRETREVLAAVQPSGGEEIVPKLLSLGTVQQVLRNLLKEGVSLRHASVIVDALALAAESTKDVEELTSHARVALGPALCAEKLDADGKLRVFALGTQLEERLRVAAREGGADSALMLDVVEALRRAFAAAPAEPEMVVLCSPSVRGGLRRIVEKVLPSAAVLSHAEIPDTVPLVRLGIAQ